LEPSRPAENAPQTESGSIKQQKMMKALNPYGMDDYYTDEIGQ
jgi:hypothetical protein